MTQMLMPINQSTDQIHANCHYSYGVEHDDNLVGQHASTEQAVGGTQGVNGVAVDLRWCGGMYLFMMIQ